MRALPLALGLGLPTLLGSLLLLTAAPAVSQEPAPDSTSPSATTDPPTLSRSNPHHGHARDPDETRCSACHLRRPAPGAPPERAALRLDPMNTCATCHPGEAHHGVVEHVGKPGPEGTSLPLVGGRIACLTCHDVHSDTDAGKLGGRLPDDLHRNALEGPWAPLREATFPGAPRERSSMLRLPLQDDRLCGACHGEGPS